MSAVCSFPGCADPSAVSVDAQWGARMVEGAPLCAKHLALVLVALQTAKSHRILPPDTRGDEELWERWQAKGEVHD